MRKARASLIASVVVGLLAVTTAGVSTYAWFQASANVNVSANSSDPVNIAVTKPADLSGSYYKYHDNGSNGYKTKNSTTFDLIDGSTTLPSVTNFKPGYKASYMLKVKGSMTFTLKLTSFNPGTSNNKKILTNELTDSGKYISAAHGINIYAKAYNAESHSDYLTWIDGTCDLNDENSVSNDKFVYDGTAITPTLVTTTAASTSTFVYLYFTIVFDDHSASHYTEYTGVSGTPLGYDGTSATRYFKQDGSGNSNCFMGLTFSITNLSIGR